MEQSLHNDEPTVLDALGRGHFVESLGKAIFKARPPEVHAVHGDWGAGKTSLLAQLQWFVDGTCDESSMRRFRESAAGSKFINKDGGPSAALKKIWKSWDEEEIKEARKSHFVLWFEAWRYQSEANPVVALLHEIREQLPKRAKLFNSVEKIFEVGTQSALRSMDSISGLLGGSKLVENVQKAGENHEKRMHAVPLPANEIRDQLEYAINQILGNREVTDPFKARRLVIIIDDLDRCEPAVAYKLLEGIKIYLNLSNCIFVLGLNSRIIQRYIASQSKEVESKEYQAREYLEKLCQHMWHVPILSNSERAALVKRWLGGSKLGEPLSGVVEKFDCLPSNFRKIKKFANTLIRMLELSPLAKWHTLSNEEEKTRRCQLAVLMGNLYYFHPEIYRRIEAKPEFYRTQLWRWALDGNTENLADCLKEVELDDVSRMSDPNAPTPKVSWESAHRDPSYGDTFRLRRLMQALDRLPMGNFLPSFFARFSHATLTLHVSRDACRQVFVGRARQ